MTEYEALWKDYQIKCGERDEAIRDRQHALDRMFRYQDALEKISSREWYVEGCECCHIADKSLEDDE